MATEWRNNNLLALLLGLTLSLISILALEGICYVWNRTIALQIDGPKMVSVKQDDKRKDESPKNYELTNSFYRVPKLQTSFSSFAHVRSLHIDRSQDIARKIWRSPFHLKENQGFQDKITIVESGEVVYDSWYETDAFGRRKTPQPHAEKRKKHLILIGCSFTFGLGLGQESTLAAQLATLAPEYHVYNHGLPGSSPSSFIKLAATEELWQGINEKQGMAVFVYLDDHLPRAFGTISKVGAYGGGLPYARESRDGFFEVTGSFRDERPGLTRVYSLLSKSEIVQAFQMDWPWTFQLSYFEKLAKMFLQIKNSYLKRFPGQRFVVAGYPGAHSFMMPMFKLSLEKLGIEHVDYSLNHLDQYTLKPVHIKYDGHPTEEAHRIWAPVLARDLGLN